RDDPAHSSRQGRRCRLHRAAAGPWRQGGSAQRAGNYASHGRRRRGLDYHRYARAFPQRAGVHRRCKAVACRRCGYQCAPGQWPDLAARRGAVGMERVRAIPCRPRRRSASRRSRWHQGARHRARQGRSDGSCRDRGARAAPGDGGAAAAAHGGEPLELRFFGLTLPGGRSVKLLQDLCAFVCVAALSSAALAGVPGSVDAKRLTNANAEPGQWMLEGRTYDQQRFSPLKQINTDTVSRLGLAWYADFDSNRGQEATPLVIDGVIYLSTAWSKVKAYDARTGRLLWAYDPKVPGEFAGRGCCDVVNRGLAAWNGKIYVASYDGWLTALDARTGAQVWHVLTLDHNKPVTSTGAPLAFNGKIVIGNAGGEF